jgi:hypothetical protein
MSKNIPTDKALYSRVKAEAKSKFDRWPSAYGSAWLVKEYKKRGGGYRKAELGMEMSDNDFAGYVPADMQEYALGGGIPQRYKNQGFTKVGAKRQSTRPGKKWMVLAKKGDKYKVVHGGYKGMSDYTQHRNEKRRDRFWDRMGGKDSAKAKDPFSPLYWHKRFGTWAEGGEPQNEGFQALPPAVQAKIMANMMYGGTMYAAGGEWFNEDSQDFYSNGGQTLYDFVKNAGLDPSFASRKNLLSKYVDGEYTGSAEQNTMLLKKLKSGEINLGKKTKSSVSKKSDSKLPKPIDEVKEDTRRFPQTGVVVDRGTNQAFVFGEDGAIGFNVLTGRSDNPNAIYSKAGMPGRRANSNYAVTPTGYFLMDGVMSGYDGNVTGLTGIPAYGVPASPASTRGARVAIHQTYDPNTREPLYELAPENRRASAGCINCKKEDFERMEQMLPANDTMFVFDSRLPQDANLLRQAQQRYNMESQGNFVRNIYTDSNRSDRLQDSSFVRPIQGFKKGGQWIQEARESMEEKGTVGAFTKQARREGYEDTQEFASYVLNNPEQFSATIKKRAQFAKNMGKLNRAMRGMELNKYQVQGQTTEGVNPFGYPGSGMGSMYLQELRDQELFANPNVSADSSAPAPQQNTPTLVRPRAISSTSGMGNIYAQDQMFEEMLAQDPAVSAAEVKPKEMMSFMPTLEPGKIQQTPTQTVKVKETGWGYEPMGAKDDAWWQKGVAVAAYAPGIIANFMQSGQDQLAQAKGRRNYLTDYSDNVVSQGLALSRGEREMNTDQLDPVSRTPVQFGNYFQTGGEAMVDESILRDLIAAGADIEILD